MKQQLFVLGDNRQEQKKDLPFVLTKTGAAASLLVEEGMISLLMDKNPRTRLVGVNAVGKRVPILKHLAINSPHPNVQAAASKSLGTLKSTDTTKCPAARFEAILQELLQDAILDIPLCLDSLVLHKRLAQDQKEEFVTNLLRWKAGCLRDYAQTKEPGTSSALVDKDQVISLYSLASNQSLFAFGVLRDPHDFGMAMLDLARIQMYAHFDRPHQPPLFSK